MGRPSVAVYGVGLVDPPAAGAAVAGGGTVVVVVVVVGEAGRITNGCSPGLTNP